MRERSHKKGEDDQRDAKRWLIRSGFLGFDAAPFGDACDITKVAMHDRGVAFDFSLKLCRNEVTRRILYAECKFRNERSGNVNDEFREFLRRVNRALIDGEGDQVDHAVFVFLSNILVDGHRAFVRDRRA